MRPLLLALCLTACSAGANGLALTYDGHPVPVVAPGTTLETIDGARVVALHFTTGSDVDASDAVAFWGLRIALDPSAPRGAIMSVAGTTTFADGAESFAPGTGHDARVLGVSASVSGFLAFSAIDERCAGTIEVVDTSSTSITLRVDLTISPRTASGTDTFHFVGTFSAS